MTTSHAAAHLQVLGPVSVRRPDSAHAVTLLTQPRRLAVLAYLMLARPRGFQSRDTIVALLWPDASPVHGRHDLRNALHAIRQSLGEDVIVRAGDSLVAIDQLRVGCDALLMEADLAADRPDDALARYEGELLQGFHVSGAPAFERWVDVERTRLAAGAVAAASSSAERHLGRGDVTRALRLARHACALAPDDERVFRRLLRMLMDAGDVAAAARAYDLFARRLRTDFGSAPAEETRAIVGEASR